MFKNILKYLCYTSNVKSLLLALNSWIIPDSLWASLRCLGLNPDLPQARQVPYPLYFLSRPPVSFFFVSDVLLGKRALYCLLWFSDNFSILTMHFKNTLWEDPVSSNDPFIKELLKSRLKEIAFIHYSYPPVVITSA